MKTSDIKGIIPPVITPMNNDPEQTVNHQALREYRSTQAPAASPPPKPSA